MTGVTSLSGITWNHTRGYLPMVATAQRFAESHPGVEIVWHKRSLQEFADYPIDRLAERFDLLVIDHPFAGQAAAEPILVPLDEYLPADFLADQAAHSVGRSHESYYYGGHQWALAIDAATPVSAYRPDLLERHGIALPQTWPELLALARRGLVALAAIPVDSLMLFYMLCCALGEDPGAADEQIVTRELGAAALEHVRELVSLCGRACLERNPIATYEAMTTTDAIAYCPAAYGYSNYARPGYARALLRFGGLVTFAQGAHGRRLRSTLGGTGLAVSRRCREVELAIEYARFVADPTTQRGLYFASGGQPGHRLAWESPELNAACSGFFSDTLETLDEAYLRPRFAGYLDFQDAGSELVHRYLREGGEARAVAEELNRLYRGSRRHNA
jgi:multiple sugar transport system substrate-binding protein